MMAEFNLKLSCDIYHLYSVRSKWFNKQVRNFLGAEIGFESKPEQETSQIETTEILLKAQKSQIHIKLL